MATCQGYDHHIGTHLIYTTDIHNYFADCHWRFSEIRVIKENIGEKTFVRAT